MALNIGDVHNAETDSLTLTPVAVWGNTIFHFSAWWGDDQYETRHRLSACAVYVYQYRYRECGKLRYRPAPNGLDVIVKV